MSRAASYAAHLEQALGTTVTLEAGRRGQFDVLVGTEVVVSRKGGLLAKIVGRPWPSDDDVLAAVRAASTASSASR